MNPNADLDQRLVATTRREVEDLLRVGLVGLYEFIQILRGEAPSLSDQESRRYASEVLDQLLTSGRARLVRDRWAGSEPPVDASGLLPAESDWQDPPDETYLAVAPL